MSPILAGIVVMLWPVLGERLYHPTDPGSVNFFRFLSKEGFGKPVQIKSYGFTDFYL